MPPAKANHTVEQQLSMVQVAELLGVNRSTIWRWIRQGKIKPVHKLGKTVRIPGSAVNRFLTDRTITT